MNTAKKEKRKGEGGEAGNGKRIGNAQ